jgi:hypothetical protein
MGKIPPKRVLLLELYSKRKGDEHSIAYAFNIQTAINCVG